MPSLGQPWQVQMLLHLHQADHKGHFYSYLTGLVVFPDLLTTTFCFNFSSHYNHIFIIQQGETAPAQIHILGKNSFSHHYHIYIQDIVSPKSCPSILKMSV